ncbi:MAG: hypothetical protein D6739_02365 [Nitrospirae bacterium]|nr:MAG: hypothetical protein D6739_02365 [Nitrospirota bacterium]
MPPLPHFLAAFASGALIIVAGGGYALCFALGRRFGGPWPRLALLCYAALAASVAVLAWALDLHGFWRLVAAVMLAGYYAGPRLIWRLSDHIEGPRAPREPLSPRP